MSDGRGSGFARAMSTRRGAGDARAPSAAPLVLASSSPQRRAILEKLGIGFEVRKVDVRELDDALLDWYLATGEWRGRSGAYAIQKAGAALVRGLEGECENVVGLPVATLLDLYPELLQRPSRA